ncbi:hypothetical protein ACFPOU_13260 [Massilia jejuensis]|uniref:Lipoprotein n=1 Tax=Massilia jejuensis TaxID=648894 RepID=A0ABW0PJB2_9BURK
MKQQHRSVLLAGLLAMAVGLSGCKAMRGGDASGDAGGSASWGGGTGSGTTGGTTSSDQAGTSGASSTGSTTQGSATGTTSDTGSGAQGASQAGSATAASASPNGTVVSIELVPRPASGIGGAGSVGGAAVGSSGTGATGSSTASDRVYRVTLRMDDGSTQVVTQETTPDFRSGDRVNISGGTIRR